VGFGVYFATSLGTSADGEVLIIKAGATELLEIRLDYANSDLRLIVAGSQQDITTNSPLTTATYFHFGLDCKIDNAAGWAYVYLNGVEILSFTGDTGDSDIDTVLFGTSVITGGHYTHFDDCYIDDTTDEGAAAAVPMLGFEFIKPNADGNYSQWTGSDGNQVENRKLVDDIPANTGDFVEVGSVDQIDSYNSEGYTIGDGETVEALIPIAYARRYGVAEELALGTRYDGTDAVGSDQDPGSGAWNYVWERQTTKPGGGAWTQAAIDDVEFLVKSRGTF